MTRKRILISNDDGFRSEGIAALASALAKDNDVWVVAPERERSAVSHAISLHKPLRLEEYATQRYWCSGTPADCIYVGLEHLMKGNLPDLVVTGINRGLNIAEDVWYSGTVAAAIEAVLHDIPAVATSMEVAHHRDFDATAEVVRRIAASTLAAGLPPRTLLNVNAPGDADPSLEWKLTKLGNRDFKRQVTVQKDPRQRDALWLGSETLSSLDVPGSDANAVANGLVSVTPIKLDITDAQLMNELAAWKK